MNAEQWSELRSRRLQLSGHICSVCGTSRRVDVIRVVFRPESLFDVASLLPMCRRHRNIARGLMERGEWPTEGEIDEIIWKGVKLTKGEDFSQQDELEQKKAVLPQPKRMIRNLNQEMLMKQFEFAAMLRLPRHEFKLAIRKLFEGKPNTYKNRMSANAFALYDRHHQSVSPCP